MLAFKEWSYIVTALGKGKQSIILRKGGISEENGDFELKGKEFSSRGRNNKRTRCKDPLAIFGTVVATVARLIVPNCSAAMVTHMAQQPVPSLSNTQTR